MDPRAPIQWTAPYITVTTTWTCGIQKNERGSEAHVIYKGILQEFSILLCLQYAFRMNALVSQSVVFVLVLPSFF